MLQLRHSAPGRAPHLGTQLQGSAPCLQGWEPTAALRHAAVPWGLQQPLPPGRGAPKGLPHAVHRERTPSRWAPHSTLTAGSD